MLKVFRAVAQHGIQHRRRLAPVLLDDGIREPAVKIQNGANPRGARIAPEKIPDRRAPICHCPERINPSRRWMQAALRLCTRIGSTENVRGAVGGKELVKPPAVLIVARGGCGNNGRSSEDPHPLGLLLQASKLLMTKMVPKLRYEKALLSKKRSVFWRGAGGEDLPRNGKEPDSLSLTAFNFSAKIPC